MPTILPPSFLSKHIDTISHYCRYLICEPTSNRWLHQTRDCKRIPYSTKKVKSFLNNLAHKAALISNSDALSQTPAKAARPWIEPVCHTVCLFTHILRTLVLQAYCLVTEATVHALLAWGCNWQFSSWDWTCNLQSEVQRPNYYTTEPHNSGGCHNIMNSSHCGSILLMQLGNWQCSK